MVTIAPAPRTGLPDPDNVQVPRTSVTALLITAGSVRHELMAGLIRTQNYDREQGFDNFRGYLLNTSGANVSKARNDIVRRFLEETDSEWAWLIDADMVIDQETLPRLLCAAAVSGAKVIGGLCCMVGDDGPIPTMFQLGEPSRGEVTRVILDYQPNTITQVAGTGCACMMIHRTVLEALRERASENLAWLKDRSGDPLLEELWDRDLIAEPSPDYAWFYERVRLGNWVSEDVNGSLIMNMIGAPVFVDCSTEVGHAKQGTVWWPRDIKAGRGFPAPKTYAIVPSKNLDLIHDTIEQLAGLVDGVVVIDNGTGFNWKTAITWRHGHPLPPGVHSTAGAKAGDGWLHVVDMPGAGIHEMWNAGIDWALKDADQRRNVNMLILNDDLELGPRFVPRMIEALRSDPDLVAVSGNYDGRTSDELVQTVTDICAGRYDGTGGFAGFAFAAKGEWFQSGYRFPEECKWWYGDNDLVLASQYAKGRVGIAIDAPVVHLDGGSKTGGDWSAFAEQLAADRVAFEARWQEIQAPPTSVAVVSSIYGGYDRPVTPTPQPYVSDWVVVTDSTEPPPAPWRAIHKPRDGVDPRYAAKAAKYQPFEFVDADLVVWLDGRVIPGPGFVEWLIANLGDADMAIYRHWGRTSILAEAEACLVENPAKYAGNPMVEQARSYLVDGYEDVNLWQSTFFAIRRNERTLAMGKRWQEEQDRWPTCLLDQIPLPPVIAECGVRVKDLPGGFWDRHGDLFVLEPHRDGT